LILASLSGSQSVPSLAFYTDLDNVSMQSALSILITSNLVSAERGRTFEDDERYLLSTLARSYITKFARPSPEVQRSLLKKQNALRSAQEEYAARQGADIFDINHVFIRDKDDYIVAKMLVLAIEHHFKHRWEEAEALVAKATDLSPNYFEVHRVAAMLHIAREDLFGAEAQFESAISLAPDRAPLRVWYAGFLSRQLADHVRAEAELLKGETLAPTSYVVKHELARILQYQRRFDDAEERLMAVNSIERLPAKAQRVHLDLGIQNEIRRAEQLIS